MEIIKNSPEKDSDELYVKMDIYQNENLLN